MPTHLLNRRLAAHAAVRNIETTIRADRAANEAEAAVHRVWRDLLAILANPAGWHHDYLHARAVLHRLDPEVAAVIGDRLYKMVMWSHREAAKGLAATLPLPYLRAASPVPVEVVRNGGDVYRDERRQGLVPSLHSGGFYRRVAIPAGAALKEESGRHGFSGKHALLGSRIVAREAGDSEPVTELTKVEREPSDVEHHLHEASLARDSDDGTSSVESSSLSDSDRLELGNNTLPSKSVDSRKAQASRGGRIRGYTLSQILLDCSPKGHDSTKTPAQAHTQLTEADREPSRQPLSDDAQRAAFQALLFPAPPEGQVHRIIYAGGWREQLQQATRLGDPDRLARVLADGIAQGKTQRRVAADLLPHVDGVKTTARRLARTYGMAVAHRVQFEMHEGNADLIDGYMVHSAGGYNARHNHALRAGTVYHRNPKPGERGFDQMPHPPFDQEDPPFTHRSLAYCCRCWLSPVMSPPEHVVNDPVKQAVFTTNAGNVVPDPAHYSDWFDQADERRRRLAVGTRRYSLVRDLLGQEPAWSHFIDESGSLLPMATLKAETGVQRAERVAKVGSIIAELRRLIQDVATWGFMPRMGV